MSNYNFGNVDIEFNTNKIFFVLISVFNIVHSISKSILNIIEASRNKMKIAKAYIGR